MPSLTFTPARLTLTGADTNPEPVRFAYTPGSLVLFGAAMAAGINLFAIDGSRLPRLQRQKVYFDNKGQPTAQMQQHWQGFAERIEQRFTDIESVLVAIQAAQQTATEALQQSQATAREKALTESYITPLDVLTASSGGAVTIDTHTRVYGDGTSVAVDSGSVSGFSPGDYVTIYYTDPGRTGGAVAYLGTTGAIGQTGDTHICGQVTVPQPGEADTGGTATTPPAWKYPDGYDPNAGYGFA